ncbi:MAG: hypothetical protein ACE5H3_10350 [Planctomycetota bacterium]
MTGFLPYAGGGLVLLAILLWFLNRRDAAREEAGAGAEDPLVRRIQENRAREALRRAAFQPPAPASPETLALAQALGFGEFEGFGLLPDLGALAGRVRAGAGDPPGLDCLQDELSEQALAFGILRLAEENVPRGIAGQRLAAVVTKCQEAVGWDDRPRTARLAQRFLERDPELPGELAARPAS